MRKKHERKEENDEKNRFNGPTYRFTHSSFFYPEDGGSRFL
jgi:hypothetical protein